MKIESGEKGGEDRIKKGRGNEKAIYEYRNIKCMHKPIENEQSITDQGCKNFSDL